MWWRVRRWNSAENVWWAEHTTLWRKLSLLLCWNMMMSYWCMCVLIFYLLSALYVCSLGFQIKINKKKICGETTLVLINVNVPSNFSLAANSTRLLLLSLSCSLCLCHCGLEQPTRVLAALPYELWGGQLNQLLLDGKLEDAGMILPKAAQCLFVCFLVSFYIIAFSLFESFS